jgi:hypothetical protein
VVGGREVLRVVVGTVILPWRPVKIELALGYAIFEPVVPHIKCFGAFHADLRVEDVVGGEVVRLRWGASWRLFVAHFFKGSDDWDGFLGVEEEAAGFGFGRRCRDTFKSFAEDVGGPVGCWSWFVGGGLVGQKEESSCSAASVGKYQVGSVGDDAEDHVAGVITDDGVGVRGKIIEKHLAGFCSFLGWSGLAVRDLVECNDDGLVYCPAIIQEDARDLLDAFDAEFVKERCDVVVGKLYFLTVDGSGPEMRRMLWDLGFFVP